MNQASAKSQSGKVLKTILYIILTSVVLIVVAVGGTYLFGEYQKRARTITEYLGTKLGDSADEVYYAKSDPLSVFDNKGVQINAAASGSAKNYDTWVYNGINSFGISQIIFDKSGGKVIAITCMPRQRNTTFGCNPVNDIWASASEESVKERLGRPDSEKIEGQYKTLVYPDYNLAFWLQEKQVIRIIVSKDASFR